MFTGPVARWMDVRLTKLSLPLKKPLDQLNTEELHPYRVLSRSELEPAIVDALGTEQYIHWLLEDTSVPDGDPLRLVLLFITYYTGGRNLVPHTPDACQLGAGYQPAQPHENLEISVPGLPAESSNVPVRVCTFMQTDVHNRSKHTVVYTFRSNGRFVATRTGVRMLINDLRTKHAYFCKIEMSFLNATREQSVTGSAKLLGRVLPILLREHWPDFEEAEHESGAHPSDGSAQRTTLGIPRTAWYSRMKDDHEWPVNG